jgi:murein L,D-transpeptidase YcbB/YkuD
MSRIFRCASLAVVVLAPLACSRGSRDAGSARPEGPEAGGQVVQAIQARLNQPSSDLAKDDARLLKTVQEFYAANAYRPMWFDEDGPLPTAAKLQQAVHGALADGLNPENYSLDAIPALRLQRSRNPLAKDALPPAELANADVHATLALAKLATHLRRGRVSPGEVDKHWFGTQPKEDLGGFLKTAVASGQLDESLRALTPRHPQYEALKQAMSRYREIAAKGGWTALPASLKLKPGQADPLLPTLVARLAAEGDLAAAATPPATFDRSVQDALRRFETRHGMTADGRLDPEVLAALNVPVAERIRQIELNLERWRWLPEELGRRHILVNIPTFHLTAFDEGQPTLEMRVVTGKTDSPTPIFNDEMTTVVFSPYWNVPPDIAKNEVIPAILRDPSYLAKNNLELVRDSHVVGASGANIHDPNVRFRQRPGPKNSLGHVKFMFPNQFDVYLHDTPAESLFGRVERDYSHGCVRVEKPFELAQWVLRGDPKWTPEAIQAAMDAGEERHVALKEKVPVYIQYQTAWVDGQGALQFRDDVYGHDASQERILPPSPVPVTPARVASR